MLNIIPDHPRFVLAISIPICFFLYLVGLALYRLYLHPLAKFPGPKLAAVTYLYEGYYDVIRRGKYTFKIKDLHAHYGRSQLSPWVVREEAWH